jgi:putative metalloprotease
MKKSTAFYAVSSTAAALLLSACQTTSLPSLPSMPAGDTKSAASTSAAGKTSSSGGAAGALDALTSVASAVPGGSALSGGGTKTGNLLDAAKDVAKAADVSDEDVKKMASAFAKQSDLENKVAPSDSIYTKRLAKLTRNLTNYDGMKLDYKVYMSEQVNAFAMADGTVRVYSGLMDLMNDDELRFVIGHEIAHVKLGHSTAAYKAAYLSSAAIKTGAAAAANSKTGSAVLSLGGDQLKAIGQKVLTSAHSRGQESDADAYSVAFMKKNKIPTKAAASALLKLAKGSGGRSASLLSSHPDPADRAAKVATLSAAN